MNQFRSVARSMEPVSRNTIEKDWQAKIHDKFLKVIDLSLIGGMEDKSARAQIREIVQRIMQDDNVPLNANARLRIVKEIEDEILGLGPLEPLLSDESVSDILVNGFNSVYVERKGQLEQVNVEFRDNKHLMSTIDRIVSSVGRRIDESSPMVDARLKDGSRVNAIIPPLAIDGPSLSIRRFTVKRLGIDQLLETGSIIEPMAELLHGIVRSRLNIIISGGTGTGKTTILNILSGFISPRERIVTIEDSAELQLQQPHVVRLETRPPNAEGRGEVNQRDLVKNCLRMRPDRIILGEVRGAEAMDMLQAMNTGHDGSLATLHANTPRDALGRLENMVSMAGLKLPIDTVRTQIASAVNVILQLERMEDGTRKVTSIQEIQGMEGDIITLSEIFRFQRQGIDEDGKVIGKFSATGLVPKFYEELRNRGLELDMKIFSPDDDWS